MVIHLISYDLFWMRSKYLQANFCVLYLCTKWFFLICTFFSELPRNRAPFPHDFYSPRPPARPLPKLIVRQTRQTKR
jgi:hypothetical protein